LELHDASARRRADPSLPRKGREVGAVDREEHVPWVLPYGNAEDTHSLSERYVARDVFEGVDCEIRLTSNDYCFDLTDEQSFAADLRERNVLNSISLGDYVHFFDRELGEMLLELLTNPASLDQSQIAASRSDTELHFDSPVRPGAAAAVSCVTLASASAWIEVFSSASSWSVRAKSLRTASIS
jgi:hypothetical protein